MSIIFLPLTYYVMLELWKLFFLFDIPLKNFLHSLPSHETGDYVRSFLEEYQKEKKASIVLASHNMSEVERLCSSVLMMNNGSIIDYGSPKELIKKHGRENMEEVFLKLNRDQT